MTETATLPDISFASYDPDEILADLISRYETAAERTLAQGDPIRLFLASIASAVIQERFLLDDGARNCILLYARTTFLDALGDLIGVTRLPATASTATIKFTMSAAPGVGNSVTIPAGTRVTKLGTQIYWATVEDLVISDEDTVGTVIATCETTGSTGNEYGIGELSTLVDMIAGVESVTNTTATTGGTDYETDDALRIRIRMAPTAFSVAGPRDAYEYWARSASASIGDVSIVSPTPGAVDVYVLLADGNLPGQPVLDAVEEILEDKRPFTDWVTAKSPAATNFSVDLDYYILSDDAARESDIQAAVETAIDDYVAWQISAIGRDVNPSKLIQMVQDAGAKRVVVTNPTYAAIDETHVATLSGEIVLDYGGLEDE